MKICSKCRRENPPCDFYKNRSRSDGLTHYCKDCAIEVSGRYSIKNRQEINERKKEYRSKNREKINELQKKWRSRNREKISEYNRSYRSKNRGKMKELQKKWRSRNREKINAPTIMLMDGYIKSILTQKSTLTRDDIPPELIEFKRLHLELKRLIRKGEASCQRTN